MNVQEVEHFIKEFYRGTFTDRDRAKTADALCPDVTYLDNTGTFIANREDFLNHFFDKENKPYKVSGVHHMTLNVVMKTEELAVVFCDCGMKTSLRDERYANVKTNTQLVVRKTAKGILLEHIWCTMDIAEGLRNNSMKLRRELLAEDYEEYRTHIFGAMTREYDTMAVINLDTGMMDMIKKDHFMDGVEQSDVLLTRSYEEFVSELAAKRIAEDNQEHLNQNIGLEALRWRFINLDFCHYFYPCRMKNQEKEERWYRFRFTEYDQGMSVDNRVFLAVIDLNDVILKASELQRENHILNRIQNRIMSAIFVAADSHASVRVLQGDDEFRGLLEDRNLIGICEMLRSQIHEEDYHKFRDALLPNDEGQMLQSQQIFTVEYRRKWKGEYLWEHISVIPDYDEETQQYQRIFVLQDVTEVKNKEKMTNLLLEEALQRANAASEAKSIFLSQVSHETRTPLNSISNAVIFALANLENPVQIKKNLERITSSVDMLDSIIGDVLDMSTIESGRVNLDYQTIRISNLLANVKGRMEPMAHAKGVRFNIELPRQLHDRVETDQHRVEQILQNLLSNAIKYTRSGGEVHLTIQEKPSSRWEYAEYIFVVQDNGIGMSEEFQKRMFEPFTRERDEREIQERGTGLGMSIVDNLLKRMGGTIKVHSQKDVGTTIEVNLTLHIMEELLVPMQELARMAELEGHRGNEDIVELMKKRFANLRILLVDDNESNIEIEKDILEMLGLKVEVALDGRKALEMFENSMPGYYNVIFMDINMPIVNGFTCTKLIRQLQHPDAQKILIYAMSANAGKDDVERSLQSGMNDHLSKPIDLSKMIRLLQAAEKKA